MSQNKLHILAYKITKKNTQDNRERANRSTTRLTDQKGNDLAFADDIVLIQNDLSQATTRLIKN